MQGRKLLIKAASRLAPSGSSASHRSDLYLADHRTISGGAQRILVGWSPRMETPAVEAIENWVLGSFNGQILIDHTTLMVYPKQHAYSVIVSWAAPTRSFKDAKGMARIGGDRYLEAETQHVWELRRGEDGNPYLYRTSNEDLNVLLMERKRRTMATAGARASFATLSQGTPQLDIGDRVRFWQNGASLNGQIVKIQGSRITVNTGRSEFVVESAAISDVTAKNPGTVDDYKKRAMEYWKKIFPKAYIDKWQKGDAKLKPTEPVVGLDGK